MVKKKKRAKKPVKTMEELTKNFEEFMKGKQENPEGLVHFEEVLKKAAKQKDN
jgi:hypothetical protein